MFKVSEEWQHHLYMTPAMTGMMKPVVVAIAHTAG
jgi:hypothetical protein